MVISYIRSPQLFSYLDPKKIIRFFNQILFSSSFYEDSLRRRTCVRQILPAVDHLHVMQVQTMASRATACGQQRSSSPTCCSFIDGSDSSQSPLCVRFCFQKRTTVVSIISSSRPIPNLVKFSFMPCLTRMIFMHPARHLFRKNLSWF